MGGHRPVLLDEAITGLAPAGEGWWADVTVGGGGHTAALLAAVEPAGKVLGLDRDGEALEAVRGRLGRAGGRLLLEAANFAELGEVMARHGIPPLRGVVADLGVSSLQLDAPERGFSFRGDGPLDMRMDRRQSLTAAEVVNHAPEEELVRIFREWGEEPRARRLARGIVRRRPFIRAGSLAAWIQGLLRGGGRIHPATRVFQALRIAVNDELGSLQRLLDVLPACLAPGGRAAVVSFHSLEDRLVKQAFRGGDWEAVTKGVVKPSPEEVARNPRARSARLRVAARR
mgnify:CR=1 FL=1